MKWIAGMLLLMAIVSCTDSTKVPSDIIQKDKMEKIMWDMLQADRFVNTYILTKGDSSVAKKEEAAVVYERVFKLHNITREEFTKSYEFYMSRPDITKVLFDSISSRADRRKAEAHMPRKSPLLQKRDSLRRLDSIRQADSIRVADSINAVDTASTSQMSDSALREMLYK